MVKGPRDPFDRRAAIELQGEHEFLHRPEQTSWPASGYAVCFRFVFLAIFGTFSTTETGGRLGCNHRMSLEFLAIRWHKS